MKVKEVNISANIAWSPKSVQPIYLAAGTSAQQYDASFDSSSVIQLYDLNPRKTSLEMVVKATVKAPAKFNKILWNEVYNTDSSHSLGTIIGGCDNGAIYLYSADKLIKNENPVIESIEGKHAGPVYAFDYNFHQPNLLATGSTECEIFIWDIKNTFNPMTPGAKPNLAANVTEIAWNRQVEHIMAATYGGRCVVYDLRKSASIIQIVESVSRIKAHNVKWHPTVATQLILTSDDDNSPFGQVWDLRFATAPLKSLEGHQRGIAASSWCNDDPDLFLTSGKENKIFVWNPNHEGAAEIIGEFPSYNQWCFDVSWCQRDPSLVATSSVDGVVSVYSVLGAGIAPSQSEKFSAIADSFPGMEMPSEVPQMAQPQSIYLRKSPKWMHKLCGANFGFGGRLISWNSTENSVNISQVITEPEFVQRSSQLEEALSSSDLSSFCQSKVQTTSDSNEKVLWSFLAATLEPAARKSYMSLLGFSPDQVASLVRPQDVSLCPSDLADKISKLGPKSGGDTPSSLDPSEQFEMIASAHSNDKTPDAEMIADGEIDDPLVLAIGEDTEGMIRHALLLADFPSAVELCLKERKHSLALIIASHAGYDLFKTTQDRVLSNERMPGLSPLVSSVVRSDLHSLASKCVLSDWKEALVAVLTYATDDEMPCLIEILGDRLEREGKLENYRSAVLCFLCAGNMDKFVSCLSKTKLVTKNKKPSTLLDLVEVMVILERALSASGRSVNLKEGSVASGYMCEYASLLASQGALSNAAAYLNNASEGEMQNLRERLYRSLGHQTASSAVRGGRNRTVSSSSQPSFRRNSTPLSNQVPPFGSTRAPPQSANVPHVGVPQPQFFSPPVEPVNFRQPTAAIPPSFGVAPPAVPAALFQPLLQQPPLAPPPVGPQAISGFRKGASSANRFTQEARTFSPAVPPMNQVSPSVANPPMFTPPNVPHQVVQPNSHIAQPSGNSNVTFGHGMAPLEPYGSAGSQIGPYGSRASQPSQLAPLEGATDHVTPAAYDPAVPRGWNDPPPLSGARRNKNKSDKKAEDSLGEQNAAQMPGFMVPAPPQQFAGFQSPSMSSAASLPSNVSGSVHVPPAAAAAPAPKKPLPVEHVVIQEVFSKLMEKGLHAPINSSAKQRLQDLGVKFEVLYDKIRENQVGPNTLRGLHEIVEAIKGGDYYRALQTHANTISSGNFSEMSQFMPAVKMLVTTCMQCQIFYQ